MAETRPKSIPKRQELGPPVSSGNWWTDRRLRWHAFSVPSLDGLQPAVKAALVGQLGSDEAIRQIIFAPRQHVLGGQLPGGRRWLNFALPRGWTPDWVLVLTDQRLLAAAIAFPDEPPVVTATPISALLSLELGTILLFSWFEWAWSREGRLEHARIYFSTVSDGIFWQTMAMLRRDLIALADLPASRGDRGLELLANLPYKFRNLIPYRLLLPDEQIQALIYQPEIWSAPRSLFRRKRTATLALVLSNYHLVVAQEDVSPSATNYGIITYYCPRQRIQRVALERTGDDLWLNIALSTCGADEKRRVLFSPDAEPQLQALIDCLGPSGR